VSVNEDPLKDSNNNNDGPLSFTWGHENLTKMDVDYVTYIMSFWQLDIFATSVTTAISS
jgi:hypothetical protein